ncbi:MULTISPECIES: hypothetical protein [unclassified Clostridioides]|uniref:hypothetical protein n=1 Tax=unclassified Clostridioides TaxID=2635829 RepID=UPI001D0F679F|nr:hypothetical protein [Clostridioides sp. ES-S-0145-01]MCC0681868.1 hypothetical protein [Clostridioides sp. ES-S-0005-03]MCC0709382.1 hypothetical protein [Clostridioides sp. ES-S-0190-01]UDN64062.1 hypothetical protein IC758_19500 [Clostridioides sp. ES-W-0016-02]
MIKNYLCKDCKDNNNGWCKKRKMQGLKNITECTFFTRLHDEENLKDDNIEGSKSYGKRELSYLLCRKIIELENKGKDNLSIEELKKIMVDINKILDVEEEIKGIYIQCQIDKDIFNSNKRIIDSWINKGNFDMI